MGPVGWHECLSLRSTVIAKNWERLGEWNETMSDDERGERRDGTRDEQRNTTGAQR